MCDIPKNCTECGFTKTCRAGYYGSSTCKHEKAINEKCLANFWKQFEKKE